MIEIIIIVISSETFEIYFSTGFYSILEGLRVFTRVGGSHGEKGVVTYIRKKI